MFKRTRDRIGIVRSNLRAGVAGYRFAQSLPAANGAAGTGTPGELESWFDAYTEGPEIHKWRHYFPIYERHLSQFVGRDVHMLEIGVWRGGSLRMWRDYLGPAAYIYGVDIDEQCRRHEGDRVRVFIGDQADPAFWERFVSEVPRIDIVLDDGGHKANQQIVTLRALLPQIAPGGVYICEDIHEPFHAFHGFIDGFTRPLSAINPGKRADPRSIHHRVASVHHYPTLTVIETPAAPVGSFTSEVRGGGKPER